MDTLYTQIKNDPILCRETAKRLLLADKPTVAEQNLGIKCLTRAAKLKDPEAMWLLGQQFLTHKLKPFQGDAEQVGNALIRQAGAAGFVPQE